MKNTYFSELIPELALRAARATVSRLGFSSTPLRAHLMELFSAGYGEPGCFLGDPVFEATFGWKEASQTLGDLARQGLLSPELVQALDKPGNGKSDAYRFPTEAHPYHHQLEAWELLTQEKPASVVVTSGTGSGKTECFMVPILEQLIRHRAKRGAKLVGVEALFLYPLNALIQSQRERLNAWTAAFGDQVRYCLYNGLTPEKARQHERGQTPNEVIDRQELRACPPPMLVTNATMLEYMLVRAKDAPILEASKGKLKWIVLDEAHTYIGSQAAELALLLRRVLHAFDVRPEQVRFVATSATIGGNEAHVQLREFLAKIAGQPLEQVHVVTGERQIPEPIPGDPEYATATLETLTSLPIDSSSRYGALCANQTARVIRGRFVDPDSRAVQLSDLAALLKQTPGGDPLAASTQALRWLDLLTSAVRNDKQKGVQPFLPLRLHMFHDVLQGLWACSDPACSAKHGSRLDSPDWPFGMVFVEPRKHCDCGAPAYELRSCNDCNTTYLWARRVVKGDGRYRLVQTLDRDTDEFALDVEQADEEEANAERIIDSSSVLIANSHIAGTGEVLVDCETLVMEPSDSSRAIKLRVRDETLDEDGNLEIVCPECGASHGATRRSFRPAMLGAPFLLGEIIPTLLEFCPDITSKGDSPLERPMRGRRMISFTDSRQGTARIAARLQQDSERNRVRGLVYQRTVAAGVQSSSAESLRLQEEIAKRKQLLSFVPEAMRAEAEAAAGISDLEKQLSEQSGAKPLAVTEVIDWLITSAPDVSDWMYDYYQSLDPVEFRSNTGKERLARLFLAREFARRPKRANNLESMGLVRVTYPKIDERKSLPALPPGVPTLNLDDWKAFLKVCLDFHVRQIAAVALPDSWRKWGGQLISPKQLLPPDSTEKQTSRLKKWPQCVDGGRQSRLVRLLAYALKLDPASPTGRDGINGLLRAAWDELCATGVLQKGAVGRYLSLDDIALAPISKGWVCPVSRRVLDVSFRGITPYLPIKVVSPKVAECRPIEVPQCDLLLRDYVSEQEKVAAIRTWVNDNRVIKEMREEGLWSDLNDRILEGGAFFRAAEHSAQQPGARLAEYESLFKSGRINLLSCSTTMEMGVDIGGISVVAMNNVPPHPANYLQRAGRAGRRAETRSVALSLCKNNPHDQNVLRDTLWPFKAQIPAPVVLLSSPIIIQRHINSMLLGEFMRREISSQGSADKLNLEWWMLPKDSARYLRFCAWAKCFNAADEPGLSAGLGSLLRHTPYEGTASLDHLCVRAAEMAEAHGASWYGEYDAVQVELARFSDPSSKTEPAFKALSLQQKRLTGEYLLRELATEGFLPGYGFPTDISSFETLTCDEIERLKAKAERDRDMGRIDNRMRSRDLPSRDTVTALREYAPGSDVVIDGLVYRSAGITLNWHAPASNADVSEIQSIRDAWRCRTCGSSGTKVRAAHMADCPDCGASLSPDQDSRFTYLEPAGFSVDLYASPHNDVSTPTFIPIAAPWVNAQGEWTALPNPAQGMHRSSAMGVVFNYTSGANDQGFAICLSCGRAEPMKVDGTLSDVFYDHRAGKQREHKRLRGRQGGDDPVCEGSYNGFAVMPALRLGHEARTDVLELLLKGLDGELIKERKVAFTIAVAVRNAVARLLGVKSDELGCDTKPLRLFEGSIGQAIVVFDKCASGYSSSVSGRLREVLALARTELDCVANCADSCQSCLLDFETRFRVDELDRHAALEFLSDRWVDEFGLPPERALFGSATSFAEHQSLVEAVTRELAYPGGQPVTVFLSGDPADWDVAGSPLRRYVTRWAASGNEVKVVMSDGALAHLSRSDVLALSALSTIDGVSLWRGAPPDAQQGATVLATVGEGERSVAWATDSRAMGIPSGSWGSSDGALITRGMISSPCTLAERVTLVPPSQEAGTHRVEIIDELDGAVRNFGARLLEIIEHGLGKDLIPDAAEVIKVDYSDRYLSSPLPIALFLDFVGEVRKKYRDRWLRDELQLRVASIGDRPSLPFPPSKVWQDWADDQQRNAATAAACEYAGWELHLESVDKRTAPHSRRLDLHLQDGGVVKLWFDQGFGYWHVPRDGGGGHFRFNASAEQQGEYIACMSGRIEGQGYETYVFVAQV
ncbi:MAG: DEAD/DEAH box helicase [Azoarcus sp.]|nr:DEAD/DEAH box helicase [Azoarcus sp.]